MTAAEVSILHTESNQSLWPASHLMKWNLLKVVAMRYDFLNKMFCRCGACCFCGLFPAVLSYVSHRWCMEGHLQKLILIYRKKFNFLEGTSKHLCSINCLTNEQCLCIAHIIGCLK